MSQTLGISYPHGHPVFRDSYNQRHKQIPSLPPMKRSSSQDPARLGRPDLLRSSSTAESRAPPPRDHQRSLDTPPASRAQEPRSLGMNAILNPTAGNAPRSALAPPVQTPLVRIDSSAGSNSPVFQSYPNPDRTLPPMSEALTHNRRPLPTHNPSIHPSGGVPTLAVPTGTFDVKHPQFPSSLSRASVPSGPDGKTNPVPPTSRIFPAPGTPLEPRAAYSMSAQRTITPPVDRRTSIASLSNSPTTSYSSYGPPTVEHVSPRSLHRAQLKHGDEASVYGVLPRAGPQRPPGHDPGYGGAPSIFGQGTYHLMTLETDQGPIQVPVDVQAASKMADEKRKRNAGASARFRQRRKEKEKEASQTIAKLEGQIRDVSEEREYYRKERDYFRGLVYGNPGQAQVPSRLPSPRQRRASPHPGSDISTSSSGEWQQSGERGSEDGRNQRRRISGIFEGEAAGGATTGLPGPHHHQHLPQPGGAYSYPTPDSRAATPSGRPPFGVAPAVRISPHESQAPAPAPAPAYGRPWHPAP